MLRVDADRHVRLSVERHHASNQADSVDLNQQNESSDRDEIARLSPFKTGYSAILERHQEAARTAQQLLSSSILSGEDRGKLGPHRAEIDKALTDIQKLCRELASDLHPSNIDKEARREYHNIFSGDVTDHRQAFVAYLKTYVYLQNFCETSADLWNTILNGLDEARIGDNSEIRRQLSAQAVRPAVDGNQALRLFLDRMGKILHLQRDPATSKQLAGAAIYSPEIEYTLSTIYTPNLDRYVDAIFANDERLDPKQLGTAVLPEQRRAGGTPTGPAPQLDDWRLDASGSAAWNQTPHYYFQYDPRALEEERERFRHVVYMDTHMGADQQFIKSDFIINVSRKARLHEQKDIEGEYVQFLKAFFNLVIDITTLNVGVQPKYRDLFLYHLGPPAFFNLTVKFLQEAKTGALHRKAPNKRVITKFMPGELIRKAVLEFWREEVLPKIDNEQRDDYPTYKQIVMAVKRMHGEVSQRAMEEYAKLPEEVKRTQTRQELFRENMNEWIGATNVVVFKRFLQARKS